MKRLFFLYQKISQANRCLFDYGLQLQKMSTIDQTSCQSIPQVFFTTIHQYWFPKCPTASLNQQQKQVSDFLISGLFFIIYHLHKKTILLLILSLWPASISLGRQQLGLFSLGKIVPGKPQQRFLIPLLPNPLQNNFKKRRKLQNKASLVKMNLGDHDIYREAQRFHLDIEFWFSSKTELIQHLRLVRISFNLKGVVLRNIVLMFLSIKKRGTMISFVFIYLIKLFKTKIMMQKNQKVLKTREVQQTEKMMISQFIFLWTQKVVIEKTKIKQRNMNAYSFYSMINIRKQLPVTYYSLLTQIFFLLMMKMNNEDKKRKISEKKSQYIEHILSFNSRSQIVGKFKYSLQQSICKLSP